MSASSTNIAIAFIITLLLSCFPPLASAGELPDLGAPDLIDYDAQTEKNFGDAFSTALHNQYTLIEDPELVSAIRRIAANITRQVSPQRDFTFYIIDNKEINAFAGPNGIIGIHSGLIMAAQSEDELAAVIAHEVAHVTQRHLSRTLKQQSTVNLSSFATLLAAILIGTQDPSAGIATYMGGMGLNLQQQLKNSRLHETEADSIGMQYLSKAGYDPHAMGEFFQRLSKASQLNEFNPPEILRTHPVTEKRLAEAENRANELLTPREPMHTTSLTLIKLRLEAVAQNPVTLTINHPLTKDEKCYQKNLEALVTLTNSKRFDKPCIIQAIKNHPRERLYALLLTQIELQTKQQKQALTQLSLLNELYPSDLAVTLRYAKAISIVRNNEQASDFLRRKVEIFQHPYLIYQGISQYEGQSQHIARAYFYEAKAFKSIGDQKRYHYLLERAQKFMQPDDPLLERLLSQEDNKNNNKNNNKKDSHATN
jgi:predicted Zn-dependent protease